MTPPLIGQVEKLDFTRFSIRTSILNPRHFLHIADTGILFILNDKSVQCRRQSRLGRDAEAPTLPQDQSWSPEFREFIRLCLEKDPARRPDCAALKQTAFIRRAVLMSKSCVERWDPSTNDIIPLEPICEIRVGMMFIVMRGL